MRIFKALGALLTALLLAAMAQPAFADDQSNAVGECTAAGDVWLVIVDDQENVLANQCVGQPESGDAALEAANIDVTRDGSGFICAMAGHPEECPETFQGQFWNYHHAKPGEQWQFYETGPTDAQPEGGSIEGWCYNAEGTEGCTPPLLKVVQDGSVVLGDGVTEDQLSEPEVTGDQGTDSDAAGEQGEDSNRGLMIFLLVLGPVLVAAMTAVLVVQQRKKKQADAEGVQGGR